jgi:uncharacterized protein
MLTSREIDDLVRRIVERAKPEKVILFGSYAKGTQTSASDLDLLVVKDTMLPVSHRANELKPLLSHTLINVDIHVYTPEEVEEYAKEPYSFVNSVLRFGKMVFSR